MFGSEVRQIVTLSDHNLLFFKFGLDRTDSLMMAHYPICEPIGKKN